MPHSPLSHGWLELIPFLSVQQPTIAEAWVAYQSARAVEARMRAANLHAAEAIQPKPDEALTLKLLVVRYAAAEAAPLAAADLAALGPTGGSVQHLAAELVVAAAKVRLEGPAAGLDPLVRVEHRARITGVEVVLFRALIELARVYTELGESVRARELFTETIDLARRRAEPIVEAQSLLNLGYLHGEADDATSYARYTELALQIFTERHHHFGCAMAHNNLGGAALRLGEMDRATHHYRAAEAIAHDLNNPYVRALTIGGRAGVACALGDLSTGAVLYDASNDILIGSGHHFLAARQLQLLAGYQLNGGRLDEAAASLQAAIASARQHKFRSVLSRCLELEAELNERRGDPNEALRSLRAHLDVQRQMFEDLLAERLRSAEHRYLAQDARKEVEFERARSEALRAKNDELRAALEVQRALQDKLLHMSRTDPLTGLSNRRHMRELLDGPRRTPPEAPPRLSLLLIDVDHFKAINDTHGHDAGDAALVGLAQRIVGLLGPSRPVARWGGEELCVALFDGDALEAAVIGEQVRAGVAALPFASPAGPLALRVSVGVATKRAHEPNIDDTLKRADLALYQAKREGRDRVIAAP